MYQFNKIPSIIQILAADWIAVMFLFPLVSKLYERLNPSVGYRSLPLDAADYVFFAIGLLVFGWLLATIFRPAVHATTFIPVFHAGGAYIPNPQMRADYSVAASGGLPAGPGPRDGKSVFTRERSCSPWEWPCQPCG